MREALKFVGKPDPIKSLPDETEQLVARFRGPLLSFFRRRVREPQDAEDLTQEVFLRLARRGDAVPVDNPEIYVFRIAANLLRDRAKHAVRHQLSEHTNLEHLAEAGAEPRGVEPALLDERGPERVLVGRESLLDVLRALEEMGPRIRDIFILARLEKVKHRDIAAAYGLTVSSVEKYVAKCDAHLARRIGTL